MLLGRSDYRQKLDVLRKIFPSDTPMSEILRTLILVAIEIHTSIGYSAGDKLSVNVYKTKLASLQNNLEEKILNKLYDR